MNQLDVVMHEEIQNDANPFGVQLEGPLHNRVSVAKRAPKIDDVGDIGRIGTIHGDGG